MLNPAQIDNTMFLVLMLFLFYVNGYLLLDVGGKPLTLFLNLLLMGEIGVPCSSFVIILPHGRASCLTYALWLEARGLCFLCMERQQQEYAGCNGSDSGVEPDAVVPGLDSLHYLLLHIVGHLHPCGSFVLSLQGLTEKSFIVIHCSCVLR